ncbi:MAG: type II toxin-antitoxin system RelE/ParE family toxin [Acidobacteriaceae bacterium]|nr:type II toxin-antitoxin system RelE/ParE family toxin [Acidobacteriaceae bacterium]
MIRWTRTAIRHLEQIHDKIAVDQPLAAAKQCRLVYEAVQNLEAFPLLGEITTAPHDRRVSVSGTPYLVYYRVTPAAIYIRAVWHSARLPPSLH